MIKKSITRLGVLGTLVGALMVSGCDNVSTHLSEPEKPIKHMMRGAPAPTYISELRKYEFYQKNTIKEITGIVGKTSREYMDFLAGTTDNYSLKLKTNKEIIDLYVDNPFAAEEFDKRINEGDELTLRYRFLHELRNLDMSNIVEIKSKIEQNEKKNTKRKTK